MLQCVVRDQFTSSPVHQGTHYGRYVNSALLARALLAHINILEVVRYLQYSTVACLQTRPWVTVRTVIGSIGRVGLHKSVVFQQFRSEEKLE